MRLHPPFLISSHLAPALLVGDATLSMLGEEIDGDRIRIKFILQTDEFEHVDRGMTTPMGQHSTVELFDTFLSFMEACGEAVDHNERMGTWSDNTDLFPPQVGRWCRDNLGEIVEARCGISDEDGEPRKSLIVEE